MYRLNCCLHTAPEAVASPVVESVSSSSVLVSWSAPDQPNGVITQYLLERRLVLDDGSSSDPVTITAVTSDDNNYYEYLDRSTTLRPHTTYEYRVAAQTSAGLTRSSWTRVVTLSASQSFSCFLLSVFQRLVEIIINSPLLIRNQLIGLGNGRVGIGPIYIHEIWNEIPPISDICVLVCLCVLV